MKAVRKTTVAGKLIHRNVVIPSGNHKRGRKARHTITKEAVQKNNDLQAVWRLWMLLANNFDASGSHVTLTYAGDAPDKDQAAKDRANFIRRMSRTFAKAEKELKYIVVTEYENKRIHHHMVVNSQDVEMVTQLWGRGSVHFTALREEGDFHDLAEYLIKETTKTFRDPDSQHKHRYARSKNLAMPVTKRQEVSLSTLDEEPEPIKGYYIPKDRVRRYEHPVTGLEHLEYVEVALGAPRAFKVWPRGEIVDPREYYRANVIEEQEEWSEALSARG